MVGAELRLRCRLQNGHHDYIMGATGPWFKLTQGDILPNVDQQPASTSTIPLHPSLHTGLVQRKVLVFPHSLMS